MALFKFRKGGDEQAPAAAPPPESVEVMRKRAKHRLIGSVVLVLVGVIGFPMLVDKQPRPVAMDAPGDIPDRRSVQPLPMPVPQPVAPAQPAAAAPAAATDGSASTAAPKAEPAAASAAKKPEQPVPKPAAKPPAKAAPASAPPAKTQDKHRSDSKAAAATRYVVQVGAFAEAPKAREVRRRLERAGMKTYTQIIDTSEGKRIRVRVGPFSGRAEADKAMTRIHKLDLPAVLLEL